ncbi:MAG: hypothetical protein SWZ49_05040 [Cyanobacteriota bacterium]|nr:hypothetical protein [Cyanobacteriota bacterium]
MSTSIVPNLSFPSLKVPLFTQKEFDKYFNFNLLDKTVKECCQTATQSPEAFYIFMQRYTHFNAAAGPLVARLASSIGLSRELFVEANCNVLDEADRGLKIAAEVFSATIDEHSDQNYKNLPHRTFAQATLKAVGDYANLTVKQRNEYAKVPEWLSSLLIATVDAYEGEIGNLEQLIKSIGVHIGSEMLADREYMIIDEVVRCHNSGTGFDKYLKHTHGKIDFDGEIISSWYWVAIHGSAQRSGVEKHHYESALNALDMVVKYSPYTEEKVRSLAFEGFSILADVQQNLFKEIHKECLVFLDKELLSTI